jgi:hypothetical protein
LFLEASSFKLETFMLGLTYIGDKFFNAQYKHCAASYKAPHLTQYEGSEH